MRDKEKEDAAVLFEKMDGDAPPTETAADLDQFSRPSDNWPKTDDIQAAAYLVVEAESGEAIISRNENQPVYPASTTKILTAITVLEHPSYDPERLITVSKEAVSLPSSAAARAGLVEGEIIRTIDCLYGLMLPSGNDAAKALAEAYGGTIDAFVAQMNKKASELGAMQTHFIDPAGFGGEKHFTTAHDMALITRHALKNPTFAKLAAAKSYAMPPTNKHPVSGWQLLRNTNLLLITGDEALASPRIKKISGVKTGTTTPAGYCLVSSGWTYDDRQIIALLFKATQAVQSVPVNISVLSRTLLEDAAIKLDAPTKEVWLASQTTLPASATVPPTEPTVASNAVTENVDKSPSNAQATHDRDFFQWLTPQLLIFLAMVIVALILLITLAQILFRPKRRPPHRRH